MRQEGSFSALSVILRKKNQHYLFRREGGCLMDGILWPSGWEALEWSLQEA